jgi:hypothetical protein
MSNTANKGSKLTRLVIYFDESLKNRQVVEPDMNKFDGDWKRLAEHIIGIYPAYKWEVV